MSTDLTESQLAADKSTVGRLVDVDYVLIAILMAVPLAIGFYHAYQQQRKPTSMVQYLLADRNVKCLAIAMSSFSTMVSATTLVGIPAEIYTYGSQMVMVILTQVIAFPLYTLVLVPIFFNLDSCSMYTYFKLRYNNFLWKSCALFSVIEMIFVMSSSILATSNVFLTAMGMDLWTSALIITAVCVTYTAIGGMRAVIWTDIFQGVIIIVVVLLIVVMGTVSGGGLSNIWHLNVIGGRAEFFNFSPNMTDRYTFWAASFGFFMSVTCYQMGNQATVQRVLTAPNLKEAKRAAVLGISIKHLTMIGMCFLAFLMYAAYIHCDPVRNTGMSQNGLVPLYVMQLFTKYPGLPGLFIAGLLAALLSTMSSLLNALSAVTVNDLIPNVIKCLPESRKVIVCQLLVFFYGALSLVGIYVAKLFPNIFQGVNVFQGVITTSVVTLVLVATFLPQVSVNAAMMAEVCGIAFSLWISIGNILYGKIPVGKPTSVAGCKAPPGIGLFGNQTSNGTSITTFNAWNVTESKMPMPCQENDFFLYNISSVWISLITFLSITLLSYLFTMILGPENGDKWNRNLIPPAVQSMHKSLGKSARKLLLCDIYDDETVESTGHIEENVKMASINMDEKDPCLQKVITYHELQVLH